MISFDDKEIIIRTEDLVRTYRSRGREVRALRGLSIEVPLGEYVAIQGRSGSGKTTLINCIGGLPRRERRDRTMRALAVVGLSKWAQHRPYEMSGGQQQRVAVARALVTRPEVILADEPTGELDSTTGRQIMSLFQKISIEENATVLMVTHDPIVEEYASLVYHLGDGVILDVVEHPQNRMVTREV
jgi:ABC-type lipoprotein export system ATPase subunit